MRGRTIPPPAPRGPRPNPPAPRSVAFYLAGVITLGSWRCGDRLTVREGPASPRGKRGLEDRGPPRPRSAGRGPPRRQNGAGSPREPARARESPCESPREPPREPTRAPASRKTLGPPCPHLDFGLPTRGASGTTRRVHMVPDHKLCGHLLGRHEEGNVHPHGPPTRRSQIPAHPRLLQPLPAKRHPQALADPVVPSVNSGAHVRAPRHVATSRRGRVTPSGRLKSRKDWGSWPPLVRTALLSPASTP